MIAHVQQGPEARPVLLAPGDILEIATEAGPRHLQVTHVRAPYPDVVRAIAPVGGTLSAAEIARGDTAFTAMVELSRALSEEGAKARAIGHAPLPEGARAFPLFRLPIRNRAGEIVYWWHWDGEGLSVAPEAGESDLPIREVMPMSRLRARLAELAG
ncbi:hypothetical protein RYZ18_13460 [Roseovarius sp. 10]|uniref:hypothetical protein n=1 Tax=Roseovarius sp. 10 TaxID=3080563 RepID=UPI002955DF29|nr:hypothetical protein [Roseovarius sp. 10]MDV7202336.1 hypothetical protein [Roseovarius sp. 10]